MLLDHAFKEDLALTFCFRDRQIEQKFQQNYLRKVVKNARLSILIPIFVQFGLVGLYQIIHPSEVPQLITGNFIVFTPILLIGLGLTFLPNFHKILQLTLAVVCLVSAISIIQIMIDIDIPIKDPDDITNIYSVFIITIALVLVTFYAYTASQLSLVYATSVSILIWLSLNITFVANLSPSGEFLWASNFDMLVANIIGIFANRSMQFHLRKDFWQNHLLESEKNKSEQLLLNVLPEAIAKRLKENPQTIADSFTEVTILFADIVGFTCLSGKLPPQELVDMLNQIFSAFDLLAEKHNLEKIKTIGDAYMVVGGLPYPRKDHAAAIANMALDMQQEISRLNHVINQKFAMRIGINSGEVVAGVIGRRKFIYDLWGDAVNTASRMESQGLPNQIQVSESTYQLLKDVYTFEPRGEVEIKGKGRMATYLLTGKATAIHPPTNAAMPS